MTDAPDSPGDGEESGERIDEVQPVSSLLRPTQSHRSGSDVSESNAEQTSQSDSEESDSEDTGELDELIPVSSLLRPGQRVREDDSASGGDDGD